MVALPTPLSEFPRTLNGWTGEDLPLPAAVREYMRNKATDDFINRRYINRTTQQSADLYVAYSSSHPSGVLSQSPLRCFPANGWIWDQTAPLNIVTSCNRLIRLAVHRFHGLSSPPTEMAVLCFYIVDDRIMTEQDLLERLAEDDPQGRPRYVAQVEISSLREESMRSAAGAMIDPVLEAFAVHSPATEPGGDAGGAESQEPGVTPQAFNSSMVFDVFAQKSFTQILDIDPGEMGSGPRWIGRTPSASRLEIPAGWIWWVLPSVPVDNWDALIEEMDHSGVPGLKLPLASDSDMQYLANLPRLEYLDLVSPRITDAGLAHLRNLYELQWLTLQAGAGVTDAGLAHLAGMSKLRILVLADIQVTDAGLSHLKGLTALQALSVQGAPITDAGLKDLQGLTKLQFLDLFGTQITDNGLALLTRLPKLQVLLLGSAKITGPGLAYLGGMPQLRGLVLAGTQVTDASLASLADLTGLQALTLSGPQITDAGIAHIQSLTGLRVLGLENTQVTDVGLGYLRGLSQLQWLDLSGDKITDAGLEQLSSLTGLKHLTTHGKQITTAGEQRLKQGLPNLTRD
jgi:hypothetical protein